MCAAHRWKPRWTAERISSEWWATSAPKLPTRQPRAKPRTTTTSASPWPTASAPSIETMPFERAMDAYERMLSGKALALFMLSDSTWA